MAAAGGLAAGSSARAAPPYDALYTQAVERAIERGLQGMAELQDENGSFRLGRMGRNVAVVGLAGLAMISAGGQPGRGPYAKSIDGVIGYLLAHSRGTGFISAPEAASHGPMYGHGFATLFLAEAYGASAREDILPRLESAIELIVRTQNDAGGWRYSPQQEPVADLSVTVSQVMALRAARNAGLYVPAETIRRSQDYVHRSQNPDGGFMYTLDGSDSRFPLSAAAIVALQSAGEYAGDRIDRAYGYLDRNRPQLMSPSRSNHFYYGHYYAAQAFYQRGGASWEAWYNAVRDLMLSLQGDDGMWADYSGKVYGTAMACLVLSMPRSILPIFQR